MGKRLQGFSTLIMAVFFCQASNASTLKVLRVKPTGKDVPIQRQIVFTFNRAVVPIGRMERSQKEIPISITPKLNCHWRWIDRANLACQLTDKEQTKAATEYLVVMRPGIKAEDGATIGKAFINVFNTARPKISYVKFKKWMAPGHPVMGITFNQPVTRKSVAANVSLIAAGKIYKLKVIQDQDRRTNPRYVKTPGDNVFIDFGLLKPLKPDEQFKKYKGEIARRIWQVEAFKELPLKTKIHVMVWPGIESALGPLKSIESKSVKHFFTFQKFSFMGVTCYDNNNKELFIPVFNIVSGRVCNPLNTVYLSFSAPVMRSEVKKKLKFSPSLNGKLKNYDPWGDYQGYSRLRSPYQIDQKYHVRLPGNLKAWQVYQVIGSVKDEFDRNLKKPIDMKFKTDHRKPHFRLGYNNAVIEQGQKNDVPVYVTNIQDFNLSYKTLQVKSGSSKQKSVKVKDIPDIAYATPLGVPEMLNGKSGLVYGSITNYKFKEDWPQTFFAQVTNYQVYTKFGHYNSLVWVTDMRTGKPVSGAEILLYKDSYSILSGPEKVLDKGKTNNKGLVILKGVKQLDPQLKTIGRYWFKDSQNRFFIRVKKGKELAFLPLDSEYNVSNNITQSKKIYGHIHTWGTTAQGIYRAGQKIEYKIWVRNQSNKSFSIAPLGPYHLTVTDPTGKIVYEIKDLKLSEFGATNGGIQTTAQSAVGWYNFSLKLKGSEYIYSPMKVLVADFTPSPFKVTTGLNGDLFDVSETIAVTTRAELHSGGPYRDANSRVVGTFIPQHFRSKHPILKSFRFSTMHSRTQYNFFENVSGVNAKGELNTKIPLSSLTFSYGKIRVESAVQDDRGKYITSSSNAKFYGVNRFVGLKNTKWTYKKKNGVKVLAAVADPNGKPALDTKINLSFQWREVKAVKVKGAGNAFITKHVTNWVQEDKCETISKGDPIECWFKPKHTGSYKIIASIKDTKGRQNTSEVWAWVVGPGRVVWGDSNQNNVEIIPETDKINVGDTARFLIKNPFQKANALITVERYGIINKYVKTFNTSTPIIEVPITKDHLPGFYLSVVLTSPRVKGAKGFGKLDLGKPSVRVGYFRMDVKDPYKELVITTKSNKKIYAPREKVTLDIKARPRHRKGKSEPTELAVAVLDEAVFDLILSGEDNYDLYKGFYSLDGLDVLNFSTLTRLIGRQKFEKKGANQGGGGGSGFSMRNIFKYLTYWNPSIKLKKNGKTRVTFKAPDNLTGWRVLVMGTTPTDTMGLGQSNFKVNRMTEIRAALPNQVTEGDKFTARFTVMNRTKKTRNVAVTVMASGNVKGTLKRNTKTFNVTLKPFVRKTIDFPVESISVKKLRSNKSGRIKFQVIAKDKIDKDGLVHYLPVKKRRSLVTGANYGSTTKDKVDVSVKIPKNIYPDVGDISVVASASVIGNVEGAFKYIRDYPYMCWEQKLTKGTMASHYLNLRKYLDKSIKWKEAKELPLKTLELARSYQAPNGGMTYYLPYDRYVSPYLSAYTALAFHWLRTAGHKIPTDVEEKLHNYLLILIRKNIFPTWYSKGMSSTVRAVALAALSKSYKVSGSDLRRYSSVVKEMSLFGKAHFLLAALNLKDIKEAKRVADIILNHSSQSGGKFSFNESLDDSYTRILSTPLRASCAILSGFAQMAQTPWGKDQVADTPFRLVRSITQARENREHFENTQENMFCMNALIEYSRVYEKVEPDMKISAYYSKSKMGQGKLKGYKAKPLKLVNPIDKSDIGKSAKVTIQRKGKGRLYHATYVRYASLDKFSVRHNAGIDLRKEVSVERKGKMTLLKEGDTIRRGDIVRVDIYASMPTARNFVIIDDPVPGGLEPINTQLKTASKVDSEKGAFKAAGGSWYFNFSDWHHYGVNRWNFYHKELRHDAVRFYSDYLPPGNYHVSYSAQAIATGRFSMMPVHAEEMYDPDVFGKGLSKQLVVNE